MSAISQELSKDTQRTMDIHSDAVADGAWTVVHMVGTEVLSKPYDFELQIVADAELDVEAVLAKPVRLMMRNQGGERLVHGYFASLSRDEEVQDKATYVGRLVPKLWLLDLSQHNRVFQNLTVRELAKALFKQHEWSSDDYEDRCTESYPQIEFCVQYGESDLAFLSRHLEYNGIFFFWEHGPERSKLILGDGKKAHRAIPEEKISFLERGIGGREDHVYSIRCKHSVMAKKLVVKDYNYRIPTVEIVAEAIIDDKGRGEVVRYGEHVKDDKDAKRIAKIRAEALKVDQRRYSGDGTVASFGAGALFTLQDHPTSSWNAEYLLTEVHHRASQAKEKVTPSIEGPGYSNHFVAIESKVPFRPHCFTPRPRIHGVMHGHVDSAGSGQYADIDDQGRYRVRLPLDSSNPKEGQASRVIRMAQPYAGAGYGTHFPLHKKTEVILTFLDGDVDRPIIAGSVPNPTTPSPVTGGNNTQSVVRTAAGNEMCLEDVAGSERITIQSPHNRSMLKLGAAGPDDPSDGYALSTQKDATITVAGKHTETIDQTMDLDVGGDRTEHIGGNHTETIDKNMTLTVTGKQEISVGASKTETVGTFSNELVAAAKTTNVGAGYEIGVGAAMVIVVGGAMSIDVGAAMHEAVGAARVEQVGGSKTVQIGGALSESIGKSHSEQVKDSYGLQADAVAIEAKGKGVVIKAAEQVVIDCGSAKLIMKKNGDVVVEGKNLDIKASGTVQVKGSKVNLN